MFNPIKQFEINKIVELSWHGFDISFTNSALSALISVMLVIALGTFFAFFKRDIPNKIQALAELFYQFIEDKLNENTHNKGYKYISFFASVFLFILSCNLFGLMPFAFTFTSHIIITFALSALVLIYITAIGFVVNGKKFWNIIIPQSLPWSILLLVTPIELLSYLIRSLSLSIRLFANMMAGHIALDIFANMVVLMQVFGFLPFIVLFLLIGFEFVISIVQAYIFLTMSCVYMNDALNPDH